jgi:hypothetical protein
MDRRSTDSLLTQRSPDPIMLFACINVPRHRRSRQLVGQDMFDVGGDPASNTRPDEASLLMHAKLAIAAVTIVILTSAFFVGKTRLSAWQPCAEACSLGAFRLRNRDLPSADFLPRFIVRSAQFWRLVRRGTRQKVYRPVTRERHRASVGAFCLLLERLSLLSLI